MVDIAAAMLIEATNTICTDPSWVGVVSVLTAEGVSVDEVPNGRLVDGFCVEKTSLDGISIETVLCSALVVSVVFVAITKMVLNSYIIQVIVTPYQFLL